MFSLYKSVKNLSILHRLRKITNDIWDLDIQKFITNHRFFYLTSDFLDHFFTWTRQVHTFVQRVAVNLCHFDGKTSWKWRSTRYHCQSNRIVAWQAHIDIDWNKIKSFTYWSYHAKTEWLDLTFLFLNRWLQHWNRLKSSDNQMNFHCKWDGRLLSHKCNGLIFLCPKA